MDPPLDPEDPPEFDPDAPWREPESEVPESGAPPDPDGDPELEPELPVGTFDWSDVEPHAQAKTTAAGSSQ